MSPQIGEAHIAPFDGSPQPTSADAARFMLDRITRGSTIGEAYTAAVAALGEDVTKRVVARLVGEMGARSWKEADLICAALVRIARAPELRRATAKVG